MPLEVCWPTGTLRLGLFGSATEKSRRTMR